MKSTDRVTICGLPGSGKTTLARWLATQAEPNLIIVDALGQYMDHFAKECIRYPKQMDPMFLEGIAKELWQKSNTVLLVEEAEQFMRQGKPLLPYTSGLVRMGRNWGVGIIAVTRRIQELSKEFFGHCQEVYFFKCDLKSREYISDLLGAEFVKPHIKRTSNITGYTINTLPQYSFLYYNLETERAQVARLNIETVRHHLEQVGKKPKEVETAMPAQPSKAPTSDKELAQPQQETKEEPQLWVPRRR